MTSVIVVVGEALVDLVIGLDGAVERGARRRAVQHGAHVRPARARRSAFMGAVSDDRFGTMIAAQLADDHVSTGSRAACRAFRRRSPRPSSTLSGAATYRFYTEATSAPALQPAALPAATATLFTGGLGLVLEPMADTVTGLVDDGRRRRDGDGRPELPSRRDRRSRPVPRPRRRRARASRRGEGQRRRPRLPVAGRARRSTPPAGCSTGGPRVVLLTAGGSHVTVFTAARRATGRASARRSTSSTRSVPATRSPAGSCRGGPLSARRPGRSRRPRSPRRRGGGRQPGRRHRVHAPWRRSAVAPRARRRLGRVRCDA